MKVAVFMGSESDLPIVKDAMGTLGEFDVPFVLEVTSAHRSPSRTLKLVREAEEKGAEVFICVAGKAAHLAGAVAAHTALPVIGVPVGGSDLGGLDALLSTAQMPEGVPVACMGIGRHGAVNAALLAVQILGLKDTALKERFRRYKEEMAKVVEAGSRKVKDSL